MIVTISQIYRDNNTKKVPDIKVGGKPTAIGITEDEDTIYVATVGSNNLTLISKQTNGERGKNITVGQNPTTIGITKDIIYVANGGNNTISRISRDTNHTKLEDILVGNNPSDIVQDIETGTIYVANCGDDSVSVINGTNYTRMKDIPVGDAPEDIGIDEDTRRIFVANSGSDSVSVIDGNRNEVVAGITFQLNPLNSGYIQCNHPITPSFNDTRAPLGEYTYVDSGTQCTAKPFDGFNFVSWERKDLKDNSTHLKSQAPPVSGWFPLWRSQGFFASDKPPENLVITEFGTFTANFREVPPAVPPEFWLQTYVLVAGVVVGFSYQALQD